MRLPVFAFALSFALSAQNAKIYVGAFPGKVLVIDENQEKIIEQIPLQTGVPHNLLLSADKKTLYVSTWRNNGIEVIDLATRKVTNQFVLNEGNRRVWLHGFAPDPQGRLLYGVIKAAVKQVDRFELENPKFAVIDLAQRKVIKTVDYPKEEASVFGLGAGYRVSPDGKFLYAFRENVLVFDTTDFKVVEKFELSKPLFPGMETINIGPIEDPNEPPGIMSALFGATDPIVRRRIFGIAQVNLTSRTFDFTPVGPSTTGMMGLRLSPDRKTGYTVAFHDSLGNRRCEFWVFDMATRKLTKQVEFPGPTNFRFTLAGNGKHIYIYGSSPILEIYDIATLQRRKVIDLNEDLTTWMVVVPER